MIKTISTLALALVLTGCSVILPRAHDAVMLSQLVTVDQELDGVDCKTPTWSKVLYEVEHLDRYATLRNDPQQVNIHDLNSHIQKMSTNSNVTFCELGKKVAKQRINAASSAWKGR